MENHVATSWTTAVQRIRVDLQTIVNILIDKGLKHVCGVRIQQNQQKERKPR